MLSSYKTKTMSFLEIGTRNHLSHLPSWKVNTLIFNYSVKQKGQSIYPQFLRWFIMIEQHRALFPIGLIIYSLACLISAYPQV